MSHFHWHLLSSCRVPQLEKDLFYYKKTSRDLKRKLREAMATGKLAVVDALQMSVDFIFVKSFPGLLQSQVSALGAGDGFDLASSQESVSSDVTRFNGVQPTPPARRETPRDVASGGHAEGTWDRLPHGHGRVSRKELRDVMLRKSLSEQDSGQLAGAYMHVHLRYM